MGVPEGSETYGLVWKLSPITCLNCCDLRCITYSGCFSMHGWLNGPVSPNSLCYSVQSSYSVFERGATHGKTAITEIVESHGDFVCHIKFTANNCTNVGSTVPRYSGCCLLCFIL